MSQPRMQAGMLLRQTYRIVGLIGRGGMGEVYEVTHERLAGRYAMKVLNLVATERPETLARFRREAQITSGLRHPNIVQVVDFDTTEDGWPYLVMELLDGLELAQLMREQGPLSLARTLPIVEQIAAGLSAAHRQSIVHRDLKPQNIFVLPLGAGERELVKIVDFGISKPQASSVQLTGESSFLGTPQYMAPEQAIGRSADVDARADQFALGVIVYEMLTGERPFTGDTAIALVYQIINVEPPLLSARIAGIPAAVEAVVRRSLAKRPEDRFATVEDMVAALRGAAGIEEAKPAPVAGTSGEGPSKLGPSASRDAAEPRAVALSTTLSGSAVQSDRLRAHRRTVWWLAGGVSVAVASILVFGPLRRSRTDGGSSLSAGDGRSPGAAPAVATPSPSPSPSSPASPSPAPSSPGESHELSGKLARRAGPRVALPRARTAQAAPAATAAQAELPADARPVHSPAVKAPAHTARPPSPGPTLVDDL